MRSRPRVAALPCIRRETCICSYFACICTLLIDARPADAVIRLLPAPACTCGRLRRAARALTQLYDDLMAPSGLRVTQFSLLRTLARHGHGADVGLARALLLDRTALSRTLDPLVERGLVAITPGRDARTREVALTPRRCERRSAAAVRTGSARSRRSSQRIGTAKLDALIDDARRRRTARIRIPAAAIADPAHRRRNSDVSSIESRAPIGERRP